MSFFDGLDPNEDDDFNVIPLFMTRVLPATRASAPTIAEAAELIRAGEVVAFPTETVYGLGADGLNEKAVAKIFKAKGRPQDNPLILHIANLAMLDPLVTYVNPFHKAAFARLWPGPITFIFEKSDLVSDAVTAGGPTVAIRMPVNEVARSLIAQADTPIAAPSANRSGRPSPTTAYDVLEDMQGRIPLILDGGACDIGVESTVLDLTEPIPTILRPGFYPSSMLNNYFPGVRLDPALEYQNLSALESPEAARHSKRDPKQAPPKSPGMKYRHYAPKALVTIYAGEDTKVLKRMVEDFHLREAMDKKVGFMVFNQGAQYLRDTLPAKNTEIRSMGNGTFIDTMGQRIFRLMRELDRAKCDEIFVMGIRPQGYGVAIMNRLMKSAGGNIIHVS